MGRDIERERKMANKRERERERKMREVCRSNQIVSHPNGIDVMGLGMGLTMTR